MQIYFTIDEAVEIFREITGRTFSASTIRNWRRIGSSGRKLQCAKIGHKWQTKREWIIEFLEGTDGNENSSAPHGAPPLSTSDQRLAYIRKHGDRILKENGI